MPELLFESKHGPLVCQYLAGSDQLKGDPSHPLERGLLIAALVFPVLEKELETQFIKKNKRPSISDVTLLASSLLQGLIVDAFPHFPRRILGDAAYILTSQFRMTPLTAKSHFRPRSFHQKEFPMALALLRIRSLVDQSLEPVYETWQERYFQVRHQSEKRHHPPPNKSQRPSRRH